MASRASSGLKGATSRCDLLDRDCHNHGRAASLPGQTEAARPYVEKAITFEFSHFMSPNSMWPSARSLFVRYNEYCNGAVVRLDGH